MPERDETIITEAAGKADGGTDWLQLRREIIVVTGDPTAVAALPEDLATRASGTVTLLGQDTLCIAIAEWNEPRWTSTALEAESITEWPPRRWEMVVFTGKTTGRSTTAEDMVPTASGICGGG